MRRRAFFSGILAAMGGAAIPRKAKANDADAMRRKYGDKAWDKAKGGFLCAYELVDLRDPANPVQYRIGDMMTWEMVAQHGLRKSVERIMNGGKSVGRKIAYLTGMYHQ